MQASSQSGAKSSRKKAKRVVTRGIAHVSASFNNTYIMITDLQGDALAWSSAASCGFKGSRKSTPFAAQVAAKQVGDVVVDSFAMKVVDVRISGPGPGRESSIRALVEAGLAIASISDVTGIPHNGCRPPKERSV